MRRICGVLLSMLALPLAGQDDPGEAEIAVRKLRPAPGLQVSLFAAEPQLRNPVAFAQDEKGRWFVVESFRRRTSVLDIRTVIGWLDEDLACRSVEDRLAMYRRHLGADVEKLAVESERIRRIEDRSGDGRADESTVFAEGFNTPLDGVAAGVAVRGGKVWFTAIPHLWLLEDADGNGVVDGRRSLQYGWGIRNSYGGHDFHGPIFGPDGKLYMSVGDRGCRVESEGRVVTLFEEGGVLRCNPDGTELEIFARGLRNPQDLAFDDAGRLWTVDNNANLGPDNGETGRVTWVVPEADYGWRIGYQHHPEGGPWVSEDLWRGAASYQVPPVGHLGHGPSGLAVHPGTGLSRGLAGPFLVCDFPGGVYSFGVVPDGAGFRLGASKPLLWELYPTDVAFGLDGNVYVLDWVQGFEKSDKGRIFRVSDPMFPSDPSTAQLIGEGMAGRSVEALAGLLAHADRRVRQEAQFALVDRKALEQLAAAARGGPLPARRHGIWGLQQLRDGAALQALLQEAAPEIRAAAARSLGELRRVEALEALVERLQDPDAHVRFQAAIALGRIGRPAASAALMELLRANADQDPFLRHAAVTGLAGCGDPVTLLEARQEDSKAARLGALLALRRQRRPEVAAFVDDPELGFEAARAIYDVPIPEAFGALASRLEVPGGEAGLLRRAVNAAARTGRTGLLGRVAADPARPAEVRVEALRALAESAAPPGRDRVLGLWRPASPLDPVVAREALSSAFDACIQDAPDEVRVQALKAAAELGAGDAAAIRGLAGKGGAVEVRAEALRSLSIRKDPELGALVRAALDDPDEALRARVLGLIPASGLPEAAALLERAAAEGPPRLRQAAIPALAELGPEADEAFLKLLDLKLAGTWPAAADLELLEGAARRSDPGVVERRTRIEAARPAGDPLAPWTEALEGGDAEKGAHLFWVRAHTSCKQCHVIGTAGGTAGPALNGIGARKSRKELLEAMLFPSKTIAPGFESVAVLMDSDAVETGVVIRENDAELVLRAQDGGEKVLPKARIKNARRGLSAMPDDLARLLSKRELRDLVEFLAGLK